MKKQIKPLAAILRFLDFSIPPYRHFERSEKSSLHSALSCSFRKRFPIFRYHTYDIIPLLQERSLDFARDDDTGIALSKHIRCTLLEINPFPHTVISSAVEKSFLHSALSCFLRKSFPLFHYHTYGAIPVCQKDPSTPLGMTLRGIALSKHIRCTLLEINPFPHTAISSAARNIPCTLLFLAPFAKGFPFSAIIHTTLSPPARKIPRLRFR